MVTTTRSLALCSLVSLLLVGCRLIPAGPGNVVDSLSVTLKVEHRAQKAQADLGERVHFYVELRNLTTRPRELTLRGRPAHDVVVFREDGAEVWRWSLGKAIAKIAEPKTLAPREELEFTVEWDQRDSTGRLIEPGRYCVQGLLKVEPQAQPVDRYRQRFDHYDRYSCLSLVPELRLRLSLEAPAQVRAGESVSLKLKIQNTSDCPLTLIHSGPRIHRDDA